MLNDILASLCSFVGTLLPFECMQYRFMQQAFIGLLLLIPMTSVCGTQVLNFRMAFFADAIGHTAFAGVALGLLFAISPDWTMPLLAALIGLGIVMMMRHTSLSADTIIAVFFSAVAAAGLAAVSRYPQAAQNSRMFLYGDILTISDGDIILSFFLLIVFLIFQMLAFNRMICISLNPQLARAHRIRQTCYQYVFGLLLALVVILAVKSVGVLLVTALLITPAAAARNLADSYGKMLWYSVVIGMISAMTGLFLSAQEWLQTSTGATIVLTACIIFTFSLIFRRRTRS